MATSISSDTLNKETDARFWAQTGYRPGTKLDPNNPTDKAYEHVWMDIFRKVQREADGGTLRTTFDHPEVAQHLSDSAVANKAAAAHTEIAASAPDAATAQQNVVIATTATQISAQKAGEASAKQPPTVSPKLVQEAGKEAIKTPPPPSAPAADHIAHAQAHAHAQGNKPSREPQQAQAPMSSRPPQELLYKETNARFWMRTRYKPGQKLDMSDEQDRKMSKIWMDILQQVQDEANAGTLVFTSPELAPSRPPQAPMPPPQVTMPPGAVRPPMGPPVQPYPPMGPHPYPPMQPYPPIGPRPPMGPTTQPYPPMGPRPPMGPTQPYPPMGPRPPMGPQPSGPNGRGHDERGHGRGGDERGRGGDEHERGRGQRPPMGPMGPRPSRGPTPTMPGPSPEGGPGAPSPGAPGEGTAPPEDASAGPPPGAPDTSVTPPPDEPSHIGRYLAIGVAVIGGGALLYYATTLKSSGKSSGKSSPRARASRVPASPARSRSPSAGAPSFPPAPALRP